MKKTFEKIIKTKELTDGQVKTVLYHGIPVALANINETFFAVSDTCSHANCSLGTDGMLSGNILMCACHGATFDITNGKALTLPAVVDVDTYDVKVRDGWVYVGKN